MKTKNLQKNDLLKGKLLSYSAAAGALLAIGQDAEAQVAYTDVDPDSICIAPEVDSTSIFAIDMNGDEIVDVTIVAGDGDWYYANNSTSQYHWWSIRALNGSGAEIATHSSYLSAWAGTFYFAKRFDKDASIGPEASLNFYTNSWSFQLGLYGNSTGALYTSGHWNDDDVDKYLGIRFSLDAGTSWHYGWVRLDIGDKYKSVTVKDYAWEQTADKAIAAGDVGTGTSVKDGISDDVGVKVFSHQQNIIVSDLEANHAQADIFSVSGQLLRSVQVESGRTEIPMENKGLYIVRIDLGSEIVSSKVIVK
jgi:hypothetical protein